MLDFLKMHLKNLCFYKKKIKFKSGSKKRDYQIEKSLKLFIKYKKN